MVVVDTSIAVKWVVPESGESIEAGTSDALDLLPRGLLAPDCIYGEFANALYKKVRRGEIGAEQARQSIAILPTLVEFLPLSSFVEPAFELALELAHPVHDCVFLCAAIQTSSPLVSADAEFVAKCRSFDQALPIRALGESVS